MADRRGNKDNLIVPSSEQARIYGSKGGKASAESRERKRKLQDALQKALTGTYKLQDGELERELGGYDAVAISMILQAVGGNVKAATFIRDSIGEKPKEIVGIDNDDLTGISIKFVNKSNPNNRKAEQDPKIVGDFTEPTNTEED